MLGLCGCAGFSLVALSGGCSLASVLGFLLVVASLAVEHRLLGRMSFSRCGSWALEHRRNSCGTWALPESGIESVSPALAGKFFTTEPPGKPLCRILYSFHLPVKCKVMYRQTAKCFLPLFDFSGIYWRTYSSKRNKCIEKEGDLGSCGAGATGLENNRS